MGEALAVNLLCDFNTNSGSGVILSNHKNGGTYAPWGDKINKMTRVRKGCEHPAESYKRPTGLSKGKTVVVLRVVWGA